MRWRSVIGGAPGVGFVVDHDERGVIEIEIAGADLPPPPLELGAARLTFVAGTSV